MNRRRSILLTIVVFVLAVPLVLMIWPEGPLDLSKDEEPFRSMVLPPKSVKGGIYMDGGSIEVYVTDHDNVSFIYSFPYDYWALTSSYQTAYSGAKNDPKRTALKNPKRAKTIVRNLLESYGKAGDVETAMTIDYFNHPRRDMGRRVWTKITELFK